MRDDQRSVPGGVLFLRNFDPLWMAARKYTMLDCYPPNRVEVPEVYVQFLCLHRDCAPLCSTTEPQARSEEIY